MGSETLAQRVLAKALQKLGTPEILARALHIPHAALLDYLQGRTATPDAILLRAVDLVLDDLPTVHPPGVESPQDSKRDR